MAALNDTQQLGFNYFFILKKPKITAIDSHPENCTSMKKFKEISA